MIPLSQHVRAPREVEYAAEALGRHPAGDGPFTRRVEVALEGLTDGAPVLLTPSGTAALELAALLCEIGPGDEVILPSFTFPSTANAFLLRGAELVFADVDPETWSMELPEVEARWSSRTRAVVMMPYGGVQRDTRAIEACCARRGAHLVMDAAHGLCGSADGRPLAAHGSLATLSFHATKNLSCGEGGALVVNDRGLLERARVVREKGTDRSRFLRGEIDRYTWRDLGSSFLLSDVLAAVLTAQLEQLSEIQAHRHVIWQAYRAALEPHASRLGLGLQHIPAGLVHPAHLFAVLLPAAADRRAVVARMEAEGVRAASHYEPLHRAPIWQGATRGELPVTDRVAGSILRLPLHLGLSAADAGRIAAALVEVLGGT